jgi:ribonuclease P protein component
LTKKVESLKHAGEFKRAYKRGNFAVTKNLVVYIVKNGDGINKLGISVKKNIGKSVKRNRVKRLIKENFRAAGSELKQGYDIVFVVRKNYDNQASFWDIKRSMEYMFKKLDMYKTGKQK